MVDLAVYMGKEEPNIHVIPWQTYFLFILRQHLTVFYSLLLKQFFTAEAVCPHASLTVWSFWFCPQKAHTKRMCVCVLHWSIVFTQL